MPKNKFRVYLAGPISGCNDTQIRQWRDEVKRKYGKHFDFIDPAEMQKTSSYEIVETDLRAIQDADGLLVNMWRESIGSAIGIVHAHKAGRPVVVANPNHLDNLVLNFYAEAVEDNPLKAANVLLDILNADASWNVIKSGGRGDEPFRRQKLVASIRTACRDAGYNDIVVPVLVLPRVIERLGKSNRKVKEQLTTSDINKEVLASFAELEADPAYANAVEGLSTKWKISHEKKDLLTEPSQLRDTTPQSSKLQVNISCGKSHGTIWGNTVKRLDDIPSSEARRVFQSVIDVPGITQIILTAFGRKSERSSCCAFVNLSKTRFVIEGTLFDKGKKGTMQTFQVRVQDDSQKNRILDGIITNLKERDLWAV